jgi:hypothetical protein
MQVLQYKSHLGVFGDPQVGICSLFGGSYIDNDFISIGSFSISMPPRQCVSESSIVRIDWPTSSRCDAQLPRECGQAWQSLYVG